MRLISISVVRNFFVAFGGNGVETTIMVKFWYRLILIGFRSLFLLVQFTKLIGIGIVNTEIVCLNVT